VKSPCPFCNPAPERVLFEDGLVRVLADGFPVSPGHTLVVPVRHVGSFFDLAPEEKAAMLVALEEARRRVEASHRPDGYNVGLNDGPAAGQTVPHCHLHLIPRYAGDRPDPRGGVRWVLPEKAAYWKE
jgi:diadenosine tetraphosphate (Ap4A) HIT family hydrolase